MQRQCNSSVDLPREAVCETRQTAVPGSQLLRWLTSSTAWLTELSTRARYSSSDERTGSWGKAVV